MVMMPLLLPVNVCLIVSISLDGGGNDGDIVGCFVKGHELSLSEYAYFTYRQSSEHCRIISL